MFMNMNIINTPRVIRPTKISNSTPRAPSRNVLGGMGMGGLISRIRHAPSGCSSCGGR